MCQKEISTFEAPPPLLELLCPPALEEGAISELSLLLLSLLAGTGLLLWLEEESSSISLEASS